MLPTPLNWKKGVTGIVPKLSWEQQWEDWATTHTVPHQAAHISGTNWRVASYLETHLAPSLWWFYSPSQGKCYNCSLCWLTAPLRPNDLDKISEVKCELTCAAHLGYFFFSLQMEFVSVHHDRSTSKHLLSYGLCSSGCIFLSPKLLLCSKPQSLFQSFRRHAFNNSHIYSSLTVLPPLHQISFLSSLFLGSLFNI